MRKTISERLWEKISPEPNSGCWLWIGTTHRKGYGQIRIGTRKKNKIYMAHRVSYEIHKRTIPDGLQLDHLCRVRCCINPDHLEPVTNRENCRRGLTGKYQRAKTHCAKGHPYSPENTYWWRGFRHCRECKRADRRRYYRERERPARLKRAIVEAMYPGVEVRIT